MTVIKYICNKARNLGEVVVQAVCVRQPWWSSQAQQAIVNIDFLSFLFSDTPYRVRMQLLLVLL